MLFSAPAQTGTSPMVGLDSSAHSQGSSSGARSRSVFTKSVSSSITERQIVAAPRGKPHPKIELDISYILFADKAVLPADFGKAVPRSGVRPTPGWARRQPGVARGQAGPARIPVSFFSGML